jgi:hypothetical protein
MIARTLRAILIFLLVIALIGLPVPPAWACGPFMRSAFFSYSLHPDFPLESFAAGNLGILQPTYARAYLVVAYRHLSGVGMDTDEQEAVVDLWNERLGFGDNDNSGDSSGQNQGPRADDPWFAARMKVPGVPKVPRPEPYRQLGYGSFLNCTRGAFENAGTTLQARIKEFGADHPGLQDWVRAQDAVFLNCGDAGRGGRDTVSPPPLPEPAQSGFPALLRADRAYQIASANFYAGHFDDAHNQFFAISADAASPWKTLAPYLAARALVRKATLSVAPERAFDAGVMRQAELSLKSIISNPALRDVHPAAKRLLDFIAIRLHAGTRKRELAAALLRKGSGDTIRQDLCDYTVLLNNWRAEDLPPAPQNSPDPSAPKKEIAPAPETLPAMTDWIQSFQNATLDVAGHSIEQWQATGSLAWLVVGLAYATPAAPQLSALLTAAEKVPPSSPGFLMATFHRARLLAASGKPGEARAALDAILHEHSTQMPISALNLFRALRMSLAGSLDEFLLFAPRVPATVALDVEGRELPDEITYVAKDKKPEPNPLLFDLDAAGTLNQAMPLQMLQKIAGSERLPAGLRREVALAAWVRAVLLDAATGSSLAPMIARIEPALKPYLDSYSAAKSPEERRFAGVFAILAFPGLRPVVAAGAPRSTPLDHIDNYRDNWWCSFTPPKKEGGVGYNFYSRPEVRERTPLRILYPDGKLKPPAILDNREQAAAKAELDRLAVLPTAPDFLTGQVLAFAKSFPQDPRVPEALHLAVRTTRYGCTNAETKKFSRQAFELLHKNYPTSEWTKKTPHWY